MVDTGNMDLTSKENFKLLSVHFLVKNLYICMYDLTIGADKV